jgi:hypothetical protein
VQDLPVKQSGIDMSGRRENRFASTWAKEVPQPASGASPPPLRDSTTNWKDELEKLMGKHPKATLTIAITMGLLLGWMVKRK